VSWGLEQSGKASAQAALTAGRKRPGHRWGESQIYPKLPVRTSRAFSASQGGNYRRGHSTPSRRADPRLINRRESTRSASS